MIPSFMSICSVHILRRLEAGDERDGDAVLRRRLHVQRRARAVPVPALVDRRGKSRREGHRRGVAYG